MVSGSHDVSKIRGGGGSCAAARLALGSLFVITPPAGLRITHQHSPGFYNRAGFPSHQYITFRVLRCQSCVAWKTRRMQNRDLRPESGCQSANETMAAMRILVSAPIDHS